MSDPGAVITPGSVHGDRSAQPVEILPEMRHVPTPLEGVAWAGWFVLLVVASTALSGSLAWFVYAVGMFIGIAACGLTVRRERALRRD
jgi:hypothetical protein